MAYQKPKTKLKYKKSGLKKISQYYKKFNNTNIIFQYKSYMIFYEKHFYI